MFRMFIALGVAAASVVSTAPQTAAPIPLPSATAVRIRAEGQRAYEAARRKHGTAKPAAPASAPARRATPVPAGFTPRPPKPPRRAAGSGQLGTPGETPGEPLAVRVLDAWNNRAVGVTVV